MHRMIAIIGSALALAACSSSGSLDVFKSGPMLDSVQIESEPPGAEAKASSGQSCKTPCSLALPSDQPQAITFSLPGYDTDAEQLEVVTGAGEPPRLRPNPVFAELSPAAAKPAAKKPVRRARPVARKPAPKPKKQAAKPAPKAAANPAPAPAAAPAAAPAPAPAPAAAAPTFAPPPAANTSPWPAPPPQR